MTINNKAIFCTLLLAIISGGMLTHTVPKSNKYFKDIISNINHATFIEASGEYGGLEVTVAVEPITTNHLPNITGTCTVGEDMFFTIKKGNTGIVSETIGKLCDTSPYTLNPTITLPDGKYRVDVEIGNALACNTMNGTSNNDTLAGILGRDCLYGLDGNDTISNINVDVNTGFYGDKAIGGKGNDILFSGTQNESGQIVIQGDEGDDTITGGSGVNGLSTISNYLNGSNDSVLGVGEHDELIGGTVNIAQNTFQLVSYGTPKLYYLGNGDSDYASISNFNIGYDQITLIGSSLNYIVTYNSGITSLYYIDINGNQDLIAKIESAMILDLNQNFFYSN